MSTPGDEWKEGTEYEDDFDRYLRAMGEASEEYEEAFNEFAEAIQSFVDEYSYWVLKVAIKHTMEDQVTDEQAARIARHCILMYKVTGADLSHLLHVELERLSDGRSQED